MSIGIYKLTSINGKSYIGQSKNLERRCREFYCFNKPYTSKGSKIDNARLTFKGKKYWTYEVLEYCNKEDLNDKEIYYIDKYDTFFNGYNSDKGGKPIPPRNHASYDKTGANNPKAKKVIQLSLTNKYIATYDTINDASKVTGANPSAINMVCKGKRKTAKGFHWKYAI